MGLALLPAAVFAASAEAAEWNVQATPNPSEAGGSEQSLVDVSCFSKSFCMGVGEYSNEGGSGSLAEVWDGEKWSIKATTAGTQLNDVLCLSANECVAVGSKSGQAWSEVWSKATGKWTTLTTSPPPGASSSVLNGVSCVLTPTAKCVVVGSYVESGEERTLSMRWNGIKLVLLETPSEGEGSELSAVSCAAAETCVAVGNYLESGEKRPSAMRWDGEEWTVDWVEITGEGSESYLNDVSCANEEGFMPCIAVGTNETGPPQAAVSVLWNGESWWQQPVGELAEGTPATLESVSCAPTFNCVATGTAIVSSVAVPMAEGWNGSEWSAQEAADPSGGEGGALNGVSCKTTSDCIAVGSYEASGAELTLAEHRAQPLPTATTAAATSVSSSGAKLNGTVNPHGGEGTTYQFEYGFTTSYGSKVPVSPAGVPAVGYPFEVSQTIGGLVSSVTYHFRIVATNATGTVYGSDETFTTEAAPPVENWEIEPTPNPSEAEGSEQSLGDASCFSGSFCMAVGEYSNGEGSGALAEVWDGEEWSTTPTTGEVELNDVWCLSGACAAVGSKGGKAWAETWNQVSKTWSTLSVPSPAEATNVVLNGISCVEESGLECMVVGGYVKSGEERTLAIRLNGGGWTILTTPNEGEGSTLSAVSCSSKGNCVAVGHSTEAGAKVPLAMYREGGAWELEELPAAEGEGEDAYLSDVSCVEELACVAVGARETGAPQIAVSMYRNSGFWWSEATAEPSGLAGGYTLTGVWCLGEFECQAVGEYDSGPEGESMTLVEEYGGGWSQAISPSPEGNLQSGLNGIGCGPVVSDCVAVGSSSETGTGTQTLALHHK